MCVCGDVISHDGVSRTSGEEGKRRVEVDLEWDEARCV